jgi:hypothetical protein
MNILTMVPMEVPTKSIQLFTFHESVLFYYTSLLYFLRRSGNAGMMGLILRQDRR